MKDKSTALTKNTTSAKESGKNLHLESLRGIMALMVLISHVELIRIYFGHSSNYLNPIIFHLGRVAVTGFFVLSGYLITMSILKRIKKNQWTIRGFYLGRIFRIWPLYYFVIILATLILPYIDQLAFILPSFVTDARVDKTAYWYFLAFLPQVPLINNEILPFAEPTWSIGVEEIFYLIIPWVIAISKKFIRGLLIFLVLFLLAKYIAIYAYNLSVSSYLAKIFNYYRYDCIALGCLIGVLHFNNHKLFTAIKAVHFFVALISMVILFLTMKLETFDYFPFAICFALIIGFLVNKNLHLRSPKWLVYVGTISYSLYLTHEIAIVFLINLGLDKQSMPVMYILSILLGMLVATVAYYGIEKPFMNYGRKKFGKKKLNT